MGLTSSVRVDRGPSDGVRMRRVMVPTRDGIRLNAALYLPRSGPGRVPVCLEITPYGIDMMHDVGQDLARRGLGYLVVDVRGRGDSEGDFRQFVHDARDGVDVIDWLVEQPWCDGRVVLTGGSYTGLNQWLIMGEGRPAIVAAMPGAAVAVGIDFPRGGVATLHNATWESLVWGHTFNAMSGTDRGLWLQEIREALDGGLGIEAVGEAFALCRDTDWWRFLQSPGPESFADMLPAEKGLRSATVPVLTISGTHDFCLLGTIYHWQRYLALADPSAIARSHLVIGPWDHAGTGRGADSVGDLKLGEAAGVDLVGVLGDWCRHILFDEPAPSFLEDRFIYYVAGAEEWRSAPSVAAATTGQRPMGLVATSGPQDVFHSGWLADGEGGGPDYAMTFDPQDRRVLEIEGAMRSAEGMGDPFFPLNFHSLLGVAQGADPTDQIFSVTVDGDGVTYHSRPLDAPLTLVGEPSLRLIVVPDQPETDLCALLHEVRTDGSAILLSTDLVRMSRCSAGDAPIRVGEENLLELNGFRFVSRTLAPGSRLRLTLRSAWSSMTFPSDDFAQVPVTLIVRHRPDTMLALPLGGAT